MVLCALAPPATRGPQPHRTARPPRFSAGCRAPHAARGSPGRLHPMTTPSAVRSTLAAFGRESADEHAAAQVGPEHGSDLGAEQRGGAEDRGALPDQVIGVVGGL